jgi:hypothetical protein
MKGSCMKEFTKIFITVLLVFSTHAYGMLKQAKGLIKPTGNVLKQCISKISYVPTYNFSQMIKENEKMNIEQPLNQCCKNENYWQQNLEKDNERDDYDQQHKHYVSLLCSMGLVGLLLNDDRVFCDEKHTIGNENKISDLSWFFSDQEKNFEQDMRNFKIMIVIEVFENGYALAEIERGICTRGSIEDQLFSKEFLFVKENIKKYQIIPDLFSKLTVSQLYFIQ